ncbi:5' DNA nuclease [Neorhizobium sp. DT-125]|uniref:5' DNA nuclease n=1 Tax=Neorhizobium sp. DT-125 TaxID=3396163 RepID=UPI003F1A5844
MTKKGEDRRDMEAADRHPAFDPARLPYFSEALSLNPLLAHPAAAMATATAIGFGFANQMASAFFGALQGAMEVANRQNAGTQEAEASAPIEKPVKPVDAVLAEPAPVAVKAKPVRKAAASAPAAKKPASKVVSVKAAARIKPAPEAAAAASVQKPVRAKRAARASAAAGAGDLKRISGIGPKLEGVLKGMGVTGLAEIAAWGDADIARFDKELGFEGRIRRDDWVGQAKALLK